MNILERFFAVIWAGLFMYVAYFFEASLTEAIILGITFLNFKILVALLDKEIIN